MNLSLHRRAGLLALTGALALTLTACGSDNPVGTADAAEPDASSSSAPELSGDLEGAGASSQESAMEVWRAGFQSANPEVKVS